MRTWLFQGNPEVFDIEGYLAASSGLITWTVARYADQMSPGVSGGEKVGQWSGGASRLLKKQRG